MSNVVGQLELQMYADLGRIQKDMEAVKGIVGNGMDAVRRAASSAQAALGAIGVGLSAAAFTAWIKGAIHAQDEAGKLAQRMGTTVEQVAGLELAFQLGGSSSEGMSKAMVQLSKRMAEGDKALEALGIRTTDTSGKMRSTREVLGEVADKFAGAADGARKTDLALQLFGKAGAEMIPVLNAGAQGLQDMDDMARKLGLTIDTDTAKRAEQFNDTMELVGKTNQGVARMVAAELLPTLTSLASAFLDNKTQGDKLANTAQFIANTLKGLFSVGVVGVEIFNSLGKSIGAGLGAVVAASRGDFREALAVLNEGGTDIKAGWANALSTIQKAWSGTADAAVIGIAKMTKDLPDMSAKTLAAADAYAKLLEQLQKLAFLGGVKASEQLAEAEGARKLSDAEKDYIKVMSEVRDGKVKMIDLVRNGTKAKLEDNMGIAAAAEALKEENKWQLEAAKANEEAGASRRKTTDDLQQQVAQERESIATLGMSAQQLAAHQAALFRDAAAAKDRAAVEADLVDWTGKASEEIRKQADLLRERASLAEQGVAVKEAQAAAAEWQKVSDGIGQGLTDSLFRAFEAGSGFADTFIRSLKNLFKTTILKIAIQPFQQAANNFLAGVFGQQQPQGSALGSMFGMASTYGMGSSLAGYATQYGGAAAAYLGIGQGTATGATNAALIESASGTAGYGVSSASGASIGATLSAAMPYVTAIVAGSQLALRDQAMGFNGNAARRAGDGVLGGVGVGTVFAETSSLLQKLGLNGKWADILSMSTGFAKFFGRAAPQATDQGISGSIGGGQTDLQAFQDWRAKGGFFRSDKTGTNTAPLEQAQQAALNSSAKSVYDAVAEWAKVLNLPATQLASVTQTVRVSLGDDAEKNKAAIAKVMQEYGDALAKTLGPAVEPLRKFGESVSDTLQRLSTLQTFSRGLNDLGGVFARIAGSSVDARESLIALAGGMDALRQQAGNFVQNYYNRDEIAGIKAREVQASLAGVGITGDITTRDQFRALVESQDVSTQAGREQLAALLSVSDAFASLTDYLTETGTTLGGAAAQAPEMAKLGGLFVDGSTAQVAATNAVEAAVNRVADRIDNLTTRVDQLGGSSGGNLYESGPGEVTPNPFSGDGGGA